MPWVILHGAGLRLFFLSALLSACSAQLSICSDILDHGLVDSCKAGISVTHAAGSVTEYLSCSQAKNATQELQLELLVSSPVHLPDAVLARFRKETGIAVRVNRWDLASAAADRVTAGGGAPVAAPGAAAACDAAWRRELLLSYDAWILDSELLAGFARCGALAPPWPLIYPPESFAELQAASQPEVRLYGTSYRYVTAALPVGTNMLVLYGNRAALWRLYGDEDMRRRLALGWSAAPGTAAADGSGSIGNGSGVSLSAAAMEGGGGSLQLPSVWSWEQLVDAVAAVNGTDFDGDGVVEYGICLEVSPGCLSPALVQAVAASYMQTHGSSGGVLIDPESMRWRLDGPGFRSALWTLQRLLSYSAPPAPPAAGGGAGSASSAAAAAPSSSCRMLSGSFAEGRCAFTIHSLTHGKAAYEWPARDADVVGGTRVMLLPGSTRVDQGTWEVMQDCTASSCPYALPYSGGGGGSSWARALLAAVGGGSSNSGSGGSAEVNVAPLMYGVPVGGINTGTPAAARSAAAALLVFLGSPEVQNLLEADVSSGVSSFRRRSWGGTNLAADLTAAAAVASEASPLSSLVGPLSAQQRSDFAAVETALWGHPNAAPALRVPGAETLWPHFDAAMALLSPHGTGLAAGTPRGITANQPFDDDAPPEPTTPAVTAAVALLEAKLPAAVAAALPTAAERQAEYRASVSYRQPVLTQRPAAPPPSSRPHVGLMLGLALGLGGGSAVLLVALAARSRRTLRRLRGTIGSIGDDSSNRHCTATYVVLDIQGLSDPGIPDAVRDPALRLCHDVVKQLARRYDGTLVQLPQQELPPRPPPPLAAALQTAIMAELAEQAAAMAAGAWGPKAAGVPGGHGSAAYDGGEGIGGIGSRLRQSYWTYDSSCLSLASRDLDAPPPRLSMGASSTKALDGQMPCGGAPTTAATHSAAGTVAANHELTGPFRVLAASAAPWPAFLPAQSCGYTTATTTDSSGQLWPLAGVRGGAAHATGGSALPPVHAFPPYRSGPASPILSETAAGMPLDAAGVVSVEGHGAGGAAAAAATGVGRPRASFGACSGRSLLRVVVEAPEGPFEPAAAAVATCSSASLEAGAATGTGAANGPQFGLGYSSSSPGGGYSTSGGGVGATSPESQCLHIAPHQMSCPAAAPRRTSMQLHHAATAAAAAFNGPCRHGSSKDLQSAGLLSEMLLPLPAAAASPSHAITIAASAAAPAESGGGCGAGGELQLGGIKPASSPVWPYSEQQQRQYYQQPHRQHHHQQQHVMPQSPVVMYNTCSGEMSRPSQDSDGVASSGPGLYGTAHMVSALPTLLEGTADSPGGDANGGAAAAGAEDAPLGRRAWHGGAMSTPAMPVLGRQHGLSLPRLHPVPHSPLSGAAASGASPAGNQPSVSRGGGGALAVAVAAAKAAAGAATAPPPPLRTRLALVFSSVQDAVCFCVHMQAMLANCRWSPELLELPICQPIAVRPRPVGADGQQAGAAGATSGEPAGGGGAAYSANVGRGAAGSGAGTAGGTAAGSGTEPGGGVVMAAAQSSFMVSPSPFRTSGAVDRMRSLISGSVKGRSGRLLRLAPNSQRLPTLGSVAGSSGGGSVNGVGPDRSGLSVSRFAAASVGASGSTLAGPFTTRSLMPYNSMGAHSGDAWAVGGGAASLAGGSRSGNTTAWGQPPHSVSFGVAAAAGGMPYSGTANSGSNNPLPRSPLAHLLRGGGAGSPMYGSPCMGLPAGGTASLPLPMLGAAHLGASGLLLQPASSLGAGRGVAQPPPLMLRMGRPDTVRRVGSEAPKPTALAVLSGGAGGGGDAAAVARPSRPGTLTDRGSNGFVVGIMDGSTDGSGADGDGGGADGSYPSTMPAALRVLQSPRAAAIGAATTATTSCSRASSEAHIAPPLTIQAAAAAAVDALYGPNADDLYDTAPSPPPPWGALPSAEAFRARRSSQHSITASQLPTIPLHATVATTITSHGSLSPMPVHPYALAQRSSAALDSSSLVGSAATLVVAGYGKAQFGVVSPLMLPPVGPDSDVQAAPLSPAGIATMAAAGVVVGSSDSGDSRELSLGPAGGLHAEPFLLATPAAVTAAAAVAAGQGSCEAWAHLPLPFGGRPVAEAVEDSGGVARTVTDGSAASRDEEERVADGERPAAMAASAVVLGAGAAAAAPPTPTASVASPFPPCVVRSHSSRRIARSPLASASLLAQMQASHGSIGVSGGDGGVWGGASKLAGIGPASSHLASQFQAGTSVWAFPAPPPLPSPHDKPHASVPLSRVRLDEQEITPQYLAVSTKLMRLHLSGAAASLDSPHETIMAGIVGGGASGGRSPVVLGNGGGGMDTDPSAAAAAPRMPVRSFGEQVHRTFEVLPGVERSSPEEGITVIFRGPRVVCGISTWQYGDDDDDTTDQYDGQRTGDGGLSEEVDEGGEMGEHDSGGGCDDGGGSVQPPLVLPPLQQQCADEPKSLQAEVAAAAACERSSYATQSITLYRGGADKPYIRLPYTSSEAERLDGGVGGAATAKSGGGAADAGSAAGDGGSRSRSRSRVAVVPAEARKQWRRRLPAALRRALAICQSGQGGFVLLDGATYSASSQEALQEQCMVLHLGEYLLAALAAPLDLYLALDFAHLARLAHLRPPACAEQLSLGLQDAPVNVASICFSLVVGMQALLAWNGGVAKRALAVLREAALPALLQHGGYLVEDADGLLLTAFPSSRAALAWAMEVVEEAKHLDWPEELLGHALGEAVYVDDDVPQPPNAPYNDSGDDKGDGGGGRQHLVFRGLRLKSGLDCGDVLARVHATTGRMTYRGRVMNRAARIAGMATAGQVLCSRGLWDSSGLTAAPDLSQEALAVGESLGEVQLKGLATKMEVINCIRILRSEVSYLRPSEAAAAALDMPYDCHGQINQLWYLGQNEFNDQQKHQNRVGDAAAEQPDGSAGIGASPHPLAVTAPDDDDVDPTLEGLVHAVPLLSDSESESGGGGSGEITVAAGMGPALGGGSARLAAAAATAALADGENAQRPAGATRGSAAAMAAATEAERRSPVLTPRRITVAAVAVLDPDGAAIGGASRGSAPARGGSKTPLYDAPLPPTPASVQPSTTASLAAALAAARIRRASQMRSSRYAKSGGGVLDLLKAVNGGGAGAAGGSAAAADAVVRVEEEDDDIADRLVAGYSSEGNGHDSSGGGSSSDGSTDGVAALRGMLRRQRLGGGMSAAAAASAAGAAAPLLGQSGAGAAGPGSAGVAGKAAANLKKALRAVTRTILDESGGGGGSGSDGSGGSDGDGRTPRQRGELAKASSPAGDGASGGGGRLLNRLRSLAANRGGGGGAQRDRSDFDGEEGAHDEAYRFRPMPSARSELIPSSRTGSSPLLSTARARLLRGAGGGAIMPQTAANSSSTNRDGGDGDSGVRSPLRAGSFVVGGGAVNLHKAARSIGAGGGGGAAVVSGGRAGSRLDGNSQLIAETSFASMTTRHHISGSQLPGRADGGGLSGGGSRSFRRGGRAVDVSSADGGGGGSAAVASPATTRAMSSSAAALSPPLAAQPPVFKRNSSMLRSPRGFGDEVLAYGILEGDGEEEEEDIVEEPPQQQVVEAQGAAAVEKGEVRADATAVAALPHASETCRTPPCAQWNVSNLAAASTAAATAVGPSLPSRLASFTSSFLHRAKSRRFPSLAAAADQSSSPKAAGAAAAIAVIGAPRPASGESERPASGELERDDDAVAAAGGGAHSASRSRTSGGGGAAGERIGSGSSSGKRSAAALTTAAAPLPPPTRPAGGLMSRIESMRRKSALEPAAAAAANAMQNNEAKHRRPSDSLASVLARSVPGGVALSPSPSSATPLTHGSRLLVRSATGLGFAAVAADPPEMVERPLSSDQRGQKRDTETGVIGGGAAVSSSRRSARTSGSGPQMDTQSSYVGGGGGIYGSGRAPGGPIDAVATATPPSASRCVGSDPNVGDQHAGGGGVGSGGSGAGGSGWGGLLTSVHSFLGLAPHGSAAAAAAIVAGPCPTSPRGSAAAAAAAVGLQLPSSAKVGGGGGAGGGGSVTAGRIGRRRSQPYYSVDEPPPDDGGGSVVSSSHATAPRNQRRRSVIEVSGNVLILNAGASYAAGGWPLDVESENLGYFGNSTAGDSMYGMAFGSGAAACGAPEGGNDMYGSAYEFADLMDGGTYSGHLNTGIGSGLGGPPAVAPTTTPGEAAAAPIAPRRRASARRPSVLGGSSGSGGGGGNKLNRTEPGGRKLSSRQLLSRSFRAAAHSAAAGTAPSATPLPGSTFQSPSAAVAAVNCVPHTPRGRLPAAGGGAGGGDGDGGGASGTASTANMESGLGRLVRGLSGFMSRAGSVTLGSIAGGGAGGGRGGNGHHCSGSSTRTSSTQRFAIATAAGTHNCGSATAGGTASPSLSGAVAAVAAATAAAAALRPGSRGRNGSGGGGGGIGGGGSGSGSDGDSRAQRGPDHRTRTACATSHNGSAGGEFPAPPPLAARRRLVPELAKSAREIVSSVLSTRSAGGAPDAGRVGGGGSGGSGVGSGRSRAASRSLDLTRPQQQQQLLPTRAVDFLEAQIGTASHGERPGAGRAAGHPWTRRKEQQQQPSQLPPTSDPYQQQTQQQQQQQQQHQLHQLQQQRRERAIVRRRDGGGGRGGEKVLELDRGRSEGDSDGKGEEGVDGDMGCGMSGHRTALMLF